MSLADVGSEEGNINITKFLDSVDLDALPLQRRQTMAKPSGKGTGHSNFEELLTKVELQFNNEGSLEIISDKSGLMDDSDSCSLSTIKTEEEEADEESALNRSKYTHP